MSVFGKFWEHNIDYYHLVVWARDRQDGFCKSQDGYSQKCQDDYCDQMVKAIILDSMSPMDIAEPS